MLHRYALATALLIAPLPVLAQGTAPAPSAAAAPGAAEDPVLARVDGEEIRLSDVAATASEVLPNELRQVPIAQLMQMLPPEVTRQLVDRAVTERALVLAARKAGLDRDPDIRQRIRRAEEQELQQALLTREVAALVTDAAVRARYDQEVARRGNEEELRARHILVQTESEARAALAEVQGGADFAEVARRRSSGPGAQEGGDLGFFKRGDMVPEFAEAAFALQAGQISPNPVRSPFGWHVIKVEERRQTAAPSFEQSRDSLRQRMMQEQVDAVVTRIRGEARIERLDQPAPRGLLDNAAPPPAAAPSPATPARPAAPAQRR